MQQNSAVNPFQGQGNPPEGFDESMVSAYITLNRLLSVDDVTFSFKGADFGLSEIVETWSMSGWFLSLAKNYFTCVGVQIPVWTTYAMLYWPL